MKKLVGVYEVLGGHDIYVTPQDTIHDTGYFYALSDRYERWLEINDKLLGFEDRFRLALENKDLQELNDLVEELFKWNRLPQV